MAASVPAPPGLSKRPLLRRAHGLFVAAGWIGSPGLRHRGGGYGLSPVDAVVYNGSTV